MVAGRQYSTILTFECVTPPGYKVCIQDISRSEHLKCNDLTVSSVEDHTLGQPALTLVEGVRGVVVLKIRYNW